MYVTVRIGTKEYRGPDNGSLLSWDLYRTKIPIAFAIRSFDPMQSLDRSHKDLYLSPSFEFRIEDFILDLKIVNSLTSGVIPLEPNLFGLDGGWGF